METSNRILQVNVNSEHRHPISCPNHDGHIKSVAKEVVTTFDEMLFSGPQAMTGLCYFLRGTCRITKLTLNYPFPLYISFIRYLTDTLEAVPASLQHLHFDVTMIMGLAGTERDFLALASLIRGKFHSLETVDFRGVQISIDDDLSDGVDPLVEALLSIPSMKDVYLGSFSPYVSDVTLLNLCTAPLGYLNLRTFDLSDERMELATRAIEANSTLYQVCLCGEDLTASRGGRAFANMLQNSGSLKKAVLNMNNASNNELASVVLGGYAGASSKLKAGFIVCELETISAETETAMLDMLKRNMYLEQFHIYDYGYEDRDDIIEKGIRLYLKLNTFGRKNLLGNHQATTKDWFNFLIELRSDVSCSFYTLSLNPGLIAAILYVGVDEELAPGIVKTRKRKRLDRAVKFQKSYCGMM